MFGVWPMFKNKHIITALIVAPILSVIAYLSVDYFVSERPHQARIGQSYELVQLPNCRYASGQCGLKNGNFKVVVTGESDGEGGLSLQLESVFALDEAYVSIVSQPDMDAAPVAMLPTSDERKSWQLNLYAPNAIQQYLHLAVTTDGAVYYAESGMTFLNYETSFKKDFRQQDE